MTDVSHFISESEAIVADENLAIQSLRIEKHGEVYTVHIQLNWRKVEVVLVTQRNKTEPKTFKQLGRLIEFIEAKLPRIKTVQITLGNAALPHKSSKAASKRAPKVTAKTKRR